MEFSDYLRLANASLALLGFLFFAIRINDDWSSMTRGWRVLRCGMLGLVTVLGYGSVEIVLTASDVPLGGRAFLATFSICLVLLGLWLVRKEAPPSPLSRQPVNGCEFPGCLAARVKMRHLAAEYPEGVPPHLLLDVIEGVERHEHHRD